MGIWERKGRIKMKENRKNWKERKEGKRYYQNKLNKHERETKSKKKNSEDVDKYWRWLKRPRRKIYFWDLTICLSTYSMSKTMITKRKKCYKNYEWWERKLWKNTTKICKIKLLKENIEC